MWRFLIYKVDIYITNTVSFLNLGIVGIIIGLLSIDAVQFKNKDGILIFLLVFFGTILLISISAKALIYLIWLKSSNSMPKGDSIEYQCKFDRETNGLITEVTYFLINKSVNPQRIILYDFEGIQSKVAYKPQYEVISRSQHENFGKISVSGYKDKIPLQAFEDYANPKETIYLADWSVVLDPPLEPNESIKLLRLSHEKDIYKDNINGKETEFIFRPRIQFKYLKINIIPPNGYILEDIEIVIDNQKGKKVQVPKFLLKKSYEIIGNSLFWEIPFPKITIRYKVKFVLKRIIF